MKSELHVQMKERERERVDFHDSLNPLLESVCNLQINHTRQK